MKLCVLTICFTIISCDSGNSGLGLGDGPTPDVQVSLGFGDSPVEGVITLAPSDAIPWSFSLDTNEDGVPDTSGVVETSVALPYRFTDIGVHTVRIDFSKGSEHHSLEEFIIVNDPSAVQIVGSQEIPGATFLEGITVSSDGNELFVALPFEQQLAILDASSLSIESVVDPPTTHNDTFEGLATAPDEPLLYIIDKSFSLQGLELPALQQIFNYASLQAGRYFLSPQRNRQVYIGGEGGIALVDASSGDVLRAFLLQTGIGHFSISPDGSKIALLQGVSDSSAIYLLDAQSLSLVRRIDLSNESTPLAVIFSPQGDKFYVLTGRNPFRLLVLESSTGQLDASFNLQGEGCPECLQLISVANPVTITADNRYAAFSTAIGTIFIDTSVHLPIFRTPDPDVTSTLFCCNLTASSTDANILYIADFLSRKVIKIRIVN